MANAEPFQSSVFLVEPQWIDYNGHFNMAYYNVLFDRAVDEAFMRLGFGPAYVKERNASFFTVEAHVTYLEELRSGDPVRIAFQILDCDRKRVHFFEQMAHAEKGFLAATSENMVLHVDMGARKTAPFPPDLLANVEAMAEAHRRLPRPPQAGHVIGIPRAK